MIEHPTDRTKREGMALVIVLGFIAVLAVLGVSLMITTRIDRLATSSFADMTRARQLTHAALARALDDIDAAMLSGGGRTYPQTNIFYISNASGVITGGLYAGAEFYVSSAVTSSLPQRIGLDAVRVGTSVVGRVGYVAVDSSGYVDINLISSRNRGRGTSGGEIQLSPSILTEVKTLGDFLYDRSNTWRRFESLAELYYVGLFSETMVTNRPPRDVFVYSNFGEDLNPKGEPKVYLGGTEDDLTARKTEVVQALTDAGVQNAALVFDNLLDYVDTDSYPRNLDSFCTEAVPMINEVIVSNTITRTMRGSTNVYTHRFYLTVETWYPFSHKSSPVVTLEPPASGLSLTMVAGSTPALHPDLSSGIAPKNLPAHSTNSYQLTTWMWEKEALNLPGAIQYGGQVSFNGAFYLKIGNQEVDKAILPSRNLAVRANLAQSQGASFAVSDPRLNHDVNEWSSQAGGSVTPQRVNPIPAGKEGEGVSTMYVRDFPFDKVAPLSGLGSVGELGYLSVGQPWRTIALYNTRGQALHPVLDYFTLTPPGSNMVRRGLVNINSASTAAVQSVFYATPIDSYPGGGGPTLTVAAASILASNHIQRLHTVSAGSAVYETNRSIALLGDFDTNLLAGVQGKLTVAFPNGLVDDATYESVVRNSAGLFSYRQNLFTVYLYAQSITPGGVTGAEQRAVAIIWRDPEYKDAANPVNKMLLRFFRWL
ncbi:MAG: hypothetical protein M9910_04910 [Kiritimatiellae bacterium]|nr:hypothetical protein [Kiritimatiellia bacterium]